MMVDDGRSGRVDRGGAERRASPADLASHLRLPDGIRSRSVAPVNGLSMHVLESGPADAEHMIVLLHGFPELAYSWRRQMPALAHAGYHVVAPDLRGYGATTPLNADDEVDVLEASMPRLVNDVVALVAALGRSTVRAVVGHDFGSSLAAWCALIRPDIFRAVMMMSAPFAGPPRWPVDDNAATLASAAAGLRSMGREHYQWYYSTARAVTDMDRPPQGMRDFLRAYFHVKSADWAANRPRELESLDSLTLAQLPSYYVLPAGVGMPEVVAEQMPTPTQIEACDWLRDDELDCYAAEFGRTGFAGGLRWYRAATDPGVLDSLRLFGGRTIDVPSGFIAGDRDWGAYQVPGALRTMQSRTCTQMRTCEFVPGAGHWVQQEQAEAVVGLLLEFIETL